MFEIEQNSEGKIHLEDFGVKYGGPRGRDKFSIKVVLLDGTVFGPIDDIKESDMFDKLDVNGEHYKANKYRDTDYFTLSGGLLKGKTAKARELANRLNKAKNKPRIGIPI